MSEEMLRGEEAEQDCALIKETSYVNKWILIKNHLIYPLLLEWELGLLPGH